MSRRIPKEPLAALDRLSALAENGCDAETVELGPRIRGLARDKSYSLTAEAAEFFAPGGSTVDYVMEGYERSYLGLLIARSYLRLGRIDEARVELRRVDDDRRARIYNATDDPVIALLLAVMWEKTDDPGTARAYWKQVFEAPAAGDALVGFAEAQIRRIDDGGSAPDWIVREVDSFPELDWTWGEGDRVRTVTAPAGFPAPCRSAGLVRAPTSTWMSEMNGRFSMKKTPLQAFRSHARAVVGFVAGATVVAGGVVLMLAACSDNRGGCDGAVRVGFEIMSAGVDAGKALAKPDLRHWRRVPAAFVIAAPDASHAECPATAAERAWL